ncbi:glycosyltransferase family 2 protein [Pararhodobacter sp.]|uniref:glycosyltransferase family 2 protein n=1 Tax=Pararhodobacter sp. TaxID=2127056 RepID=UPI002FDCBA76
MTAPVSCIITSYNKQRELRAAVMSVLRQTLPVAEIIIADDGSSDGSREMIAALAQEHACITPLLRERNLGVSANRDLAIRAASQPFVTHLDGDDLFAHGKIEGEWRALEGRTDAVAYSLVARVWPGKWWRSRVLDPAETVGNPQDAFARLLARAGAIPRDMMLSRALFESAGGFDHSVPLYEDWDFKLRLAGKAREWRASGVVGTLYVQHASGLSSADRARHAEWMASVRQRFLPQSRRIDPVQPVSGSVLNKASRKLHQQIRSTVQRLGAIRHHKELFSNETVLIERGRRT